MIYFDNGATTFPKPESVVRAINNALRYYGANPGRSGHKMSMKASEVMFDCRNNVARLFDVDTPEKVIFTQNCTVAVNTVIRGLLKSGDHVVISSLEHNAVVRPLEFMKKYGVEYSIADYVPYDDEKTIENFRNAIKENTKLVICIHASNVFGVKLPVERISALCRIHGILFCLDAAQTAGVVPISLKNSCIDFLCTSGHKSLYGPMGTGLLVINTEQIPDSLFQGGTGSMSSERSQPEILPDKYESGTPNLVGIAGLNEGVKFILNKSVESIEKHEITLAQLMYDRLERLNDVILYTRRPDINISVPVISFNIYGLDSEQTASILNKKYNIAVRAGLHCAPLAHEFFHTEKTGAVRAVASIFTDRRQVLYFTDAVADISKFKKAMKKVAINV
ncbi:MAG: aminotransferase class V-fold PLP-dependent enzyme [Ruminococcus sp.]|nr:aminotransferase class V-fold PLP-dependent enzyme [Ruminococcus sp.]